MNVQTENLPNCLTSLRIEVPSEKVTAARDTVAREYAKHAKLPGFRPGKAPRAVVEAKFKKEIAEELKERLISDSLREAIKEQSLKVLSVSNVEDVELTDTGLTFTATVVTPPAFDLPEYKGLKLTVPSAEVTEAEIDESLERLREQSADFTDATDRPVAMDDFVIVTYAGTLEGQPLEEVAPTAKFLAKNEDFWLKLTAEAFLPGFSEKLVGANPGETREFDITVPADFAVKELAGKTPHYSVTLKALKNRVLPELDDAFAATLAPGKTLAEIRDLIKDSNARQKAAEVENAKRGQAMKALLAHVECELPESLLQNETQRIVGQIIRENQNRGIPDQMIRDRYTELQTTAAETARERLKGTFVLLRIAEEEKISVTREEFESHLTLLALRYQTPVEKLKKDLAKNGGFEGLNEELLTDKTLKFILENATVETAA